MRTLVCFLLVAVTCRAQRPEDQVLGVYRQMEKAEQSGDLNTWIGLWSPGSAPDAEKMRPYMRPRPEVHYSSSTVYVQGDEAVLLGQSKGQSSEDQFLRVRFVKENGLWKIKDQVWANTAYPANSVYATIPPPPGAFARAGAPWQNIAPVFDATEAAKKGWQVRATHDETYLYIRIESSTLLPPPGSTATTPPGGWPVMKIGVSGVGEFVLHANANIGDQATFDKSGRADSHRPYVAYWLMLERADRKIFEAWAALETNPLIQVRDRFFDVRIPLQTMDVTDPSHTKFTIGDAQWPKSVFFSLVAQPYR